MQRLPIYILFDCSSSMTGEALEASKQFIKALLSELNSDLQASENTYISVIAFSSIALQIIPLTEISKFKEPYPLAGGVSAFGKALELLYKCIKTEINNNDFSPIIFISTDGNFTDDWKEKFKSIKNKNIKIVVCIAGTEPNIKTINEITTDTVILNTLSNGELLQFICFEPYQEGGFL